MVWHKVMVLILTIMTSSHVPSLILFPSQAVSFSPNPSTCDEAKVVRVPTLQISKLKLEG